MKQVRVEMEIKLEARWLINKFCAGRMIDREEAPESRRRIRGRSICCSVGPAGGYGTAGSGERTEIFAERRERGEILTEGALIFCCWDLFGEIAVLLFCIY